MPRILSDTTNADVVSTRDGRHKHESAIAAAAAIVILGASDQCAVEVIHPVQVRITEPAKVAGDGAAEIDLVTKVRLQLDPEPVAIADGLDATEGFRTGTYRCGGGDVGRYFSTDLADFHPHIDR